jgi:hypothetical protein
VTSLTATGSRQATRWKAAVVGGLLSLAIAFGICAGLVALGHQTFPDTDDGARQRFQQVFPVLPGAGATVLSFQRVPVTIDRLESPGGPDSRSPEHLTYRIVVSPLGGLLLIGLSLVVGGAVTRRLDTRDRGPRGSATRMAVVFALACFGLSFLLPLREVFVEQGANVSRSFTVSLRPSYVGALIWPFVWGLAFGSLGAFIGTHGRRWRRELMTTINDRSPVSATAVRAASTGLATGIALVLLAGVLTAVVGIASHRSQAGDVLGSVRNVAGIGEAVVLGLPHATGVGLVASMGVPVRYEVTDHSGGGGESSTASILGGERERREGRSGFGNTDRRSEPYEIAVPGYALGGLLIATAITLLAGYRAAANSGSVFEAIRPVAIAAACLTVFLWIVGYLSGGEFDVTLLQGSDRSGGAGTIGPSRLALLAVVPLWTFGGGIAGAWVRLGFRRRDNPVISG